MINVDGANEMSFTEKQFEEIGNYIKKNIPGWFAELGYPSPGRLDERDRELNSRWLELSGELKVQREIIQQGFQYIDKRIDQIDNRIDQVDRRIDQMDKRIDQIDIRFTEQRQDMLKQFKEQREETISRFHQVDKRFDEQREETISRFHHLDKRFDEQREEINIRFQQTNKHLTQMFIFLTTGFTLMAGLMSLYKFLGS